MLKVLDIKDASVGDVALSKEIEVTELSFNQFAGYLVSGKTTSIKVVNNEDSILP